jgi:hypothetical protein
MRKVRCLVALAVLLAVPAGASAKGKPAPMQCPQDPVAALAQRCPCDGQQNHGRYVSCVAHYRNALRKAGCLTADALRTLVRCAARSTCGKTGAVVCCFASAGTCTAGLCQDGVTPCTLSTDCTEMASRIANDGASCATAGGTTAGSGSACTACTTTTSTTTVTTSSTTTTSVP